MNRDAIQATTKLFSGFFFISYFHNSTNVYTLKFGLKFNHVKFVIVLVQFTNANHKLWKPEKVFGEDRVIKFEFLN